MVRTSYVTRAARGWLVALLTIAGVAIGMAAPRVSLEAPPRVAAASDLQFALDEIAAGFTRETGIRVEPIYGSSGTLTQQMLSGAPYDLFLSADEGFVDRLADAGLTRDRGALYAIGRVVLFAPHGSPLHVDPELKGLHALLDHGGVTRFAIANPTHAPYGRAAEAALRAAGLWDQIEPKLALGENIAQAAQFATTGGAAGGILAYSLVLAPPLRSQGTFALIPATAHAPLRQRMVLLKRAGAGGERFYEYLRQPAARGILRRFGFSTS